MSILRTRVIHREAKGDYCLNHSDISIQPRGLGWSVSNNLCLRSDRLVSIPFRGWSPR